MPVSFSHRRVGSSILASLSEAGGNDLQKVTNEPLPPHSPLSAFRQLKRAHSTSNARGAPSSGWPHLDAILYSSTTYPLWYQSGLPQIRPAVSHWNCFESELGTPPSLSCS